MNKLRFVIDTNILVSSILMASSKADQALKKVRKIGLILFSENTFSELKEVLNRRKFDKYILLETRLEFLSKIKIESELIEIIETIDLCRDPKENKFLELAISGNADFIITGDQDLLVLNLFRNIEIISVNEFLIRFSCY